ncbi:putative NRPS-like enzyme [Aspergillus saccharolyticus JOP 1030-1]|uniref:Putative NRPS-like enzyme n=1 Tax=Aspergillus saccharolyticus JOP 1030-1 TaxID=1450539 RepID=A0A318YZB3_9EURO|nr:putative NRPS-like enzyme [Aspergillus saccharolyticus JOP 1030-1]PYH40351.1 putative NRPS-like enzyme [Aspergillus saccharolyticus JOP 1030-1]
MGILHHDGPSPKRHKPSSPEELISRFGRLHMLDDLIRLRAADPIQHPILAYPRPSPDETVEYEYFSGLDLDIMIDQAVYTLMDYGFKPPRQEGAIVALFTLSDLNMVITFFALSRLGYTVMMLSPRLSASACVALLDMVGCDTILYGQTPTIRTTMGEILRRKLVACRPIVQRPSPEEEEDAMEEPAILMLRRGRSPARQVHKIALILHSSGSTGTPKPLYLSHQALMTHPMRGPGLTSFNSLPWFHLHGLSTALQAMYMRRTAYMWDAALPLTARTAVAALEAARPESVQGVPYLLQLLVDSPRGLQVLRRCESVTYGGAPCPDELGDRLMAEGVRFGGSFGLTEAGLVAESISRPANDPYWNYMRFFDNIRPFIWMKPIGDELYEVVYLQGHPALTASNSDNPPGSYHSRDVFTPHPTIPDRWKYVSRIDDRITLVNGEKVLPLPIEGRIKQHRLVDEAVVVGVGRAVPGLLVFRAGGAHRYSDEEFRDLIWPSVQEANAHAEQFSQISRDMVVVLAADRLVPRTDKGSMIRAQVYARYAEVIEGMYTRMEQAASGTLRLDLQATEEHLLQLCREELALAEIDLDTDFFAQGMDSLQAIQLRRWILRDFALADPKSIGHNLVFEAGSIARLAECIHAAQIGQSAASGGVVVSEEDELAQMSGLLEKYSASFPVHTPCPDQVANTRSVLLTGPTGSIGAHTLYKLVHDDTVARIYCLTRRANAQEAILSSLHRKNLFIPPARTHKIIALTSALDQPHLGLSPSTYTELRQSVSLIIHTAWPVNFNLPLSAFEPHLHGLANLLQFSLSVFLPSPAVLLYCSSISTALASPQRTVPDAPMQDWHAALAMGYGRSKLIGEHLVSAARRTAGARAFSLRIGQVSGHSKRGGWNDTEALPLMIRSALTLGVLPDLHGVQCAWLPVDKLVAAMLEIARTCSHTPPTSRRGSVLSTTSEDWSAAEEKDDDSVYNLTNPYPFAWGELLRSLGALGMEFQVVGFAEWLDRLRESEARGEERVNPAVKLVGHYEAMYSGEGRKEPSFCTERAERDSVTLRNGRLRIVEDGILGRYVRDWLERWPRS